VLIPIVEISDEDFLFRRLSPTGHLNPDGTVNSNAFKKSGKPDPEVSVDLSRLTTEREALSRAPNATFRLGILQVRDVRSLGLQVRHSPTDENPAHTLIEGNSTKANCKLLAEKTRLAPILLIAPDDFAEPQ
jgi:hypothetical protein